MDIKPRCNFKAIVAVCDDWGIGADGDMVVENKADMRHFVALTKGCTVIMGRKTLESFPGGRPLKNRRNIVLTRDPLFTRDGVEVVHSLDGALGALASDEEAWVIGGGSIYEQFLPFCCEAEVTITRIRFSPTSMRTRYGRSLRAAVSRRLRMGRAMRALTMSSRPSAGCIGSIYAPFGYY